MGVPIQIPSVILLDCHFYPLRPVLKELFVSSSLPDGDGGGHTTGVYFYELY